MCHGHDVRPWTRSAEADPEAPEAPDESDEEPDFLDDDPAEDVELLTDGGDED